MTLRRRTGVYPDAEMERVDPVDRLFGKYERVVAVMSVVLAVVLTIQVIVSAVLTRWGHVIGATLALVALGAVTLLGLTRGEAGFTTGSCSPSSRPAFW
jgi:hypothetical protein